jgi:hypothetical protein
LRHVKDKKPPQFAAPQNRRAVADNIPAAADTWR